VRLPVSRIVCIANVEEEHAFGVKNPFDFVEYVSEPIHELGNAILVAQLAVIAIIPRPEVRGRRNSNIEGVCGQRLQDGETVSVKKGSKGLLSLEIE
jgi:hypothetical protein